MVKNISTNNLSLSLLAWEYVLLGFLGVKR